MNFEVHNPRPPKKPQLGSWPFWSSPPEFAFDYVIKVVLFLFIIPAMFGAALTPVGILLNFFVIDLLIYFQYKKLLS